MSPPKVVQTLILPSPSHFVSIQYVTNNCHRDFKFHRNQDDWSAWVEGPNCLRGQLVKGQGLRDHY